MGGMKHHETDDDNNGQNEGAFDCGHAILALKKATNTASQLQAHERPLGTMRGRRVALKNDITEA